MVLRFALILLTLCCNLVYAAEGDLLFARRAGGADTDEGKGIAVLADGSVLVVGYFKGVANFGGIQLVSSGFEDIFLVKYNSDASVAWAQKAGGINSDKGEAVSVLTDGSALVTGYFWGTATFGSIQLISNNFYDVFVAKYNSDGSVAWAQKAGGASLDYGMGISALADGSALVTGYFENTANFGGTQLVSKGNEDIFIAKYNSDGTVAWAKSAGGTDSDYGQDISTLADGSAFITGYFNRTATFGSTWLYSKGSSDVFTAKYNSNGSLAWAQKGGGTSTDYGYGISASSDGGALITGSFKYTGTFGNTTVAARGSDDIFVVKYNSDGNVAWAQKAADSTQIMVRLYLH